LTDIAAPGLPVRSKLPFLFQSRGLLLRGFELRSQANDRSSQARIERKKVSIFNLNLKERNQKAAPRKHVKLLIVLFLINLKKVVTHNTNEHCDELDAHVSQIARIFSPKISSPPCQLS